MGRIIGGVIVGYLVMVLIIFSTFTAAYFAMGADGAFRPGTYDPSGLWLTVSFILGLLASIIGGYVCALIARSPKGTMALAIFVLVLGLLAAIPAMMRSGDDSPNVRTGDVSNLEAMQQARQPLWVLLVNPFLGAAGALIGGRLKRS